MSLRTAWEPEVSEGIRCPNQWRCSHPCKCHGYATREEYEADVAQHYEIVGKHRRVAPTVPFRHAFRGADPAPTVSPDA